MSTAPSQWSDAATATTSTPASTSLAAVDEPTPVSAATNHDVWDVWPVRAEIFGEASVTARRVADDPMGLTDDGRAWSDRVDAAVQGYTTHDPGALTAWMGAHAASVTPELYEARIVAGWESRYPPMDYDAVGIDTNDVDSDVGTVAEPAAGAGTAFTVECAPCELDFLDVTERGEARYLADTHNDLHHGGRDEAVTVDVDAALDAWSDELDDGDADVWD